PQEQRELYDRSPYNIVRVELGLGGEKDTPEDSRYTRAAAFLGRWVKEGVLVPEERPALYLTHQLFRYGGKEHVRKGLMALVKLEEFEEGGVRPHEETAQEAKRDRLELMQACRANISPIMALYDEPGGGLAEAFASVGKRPPDVTGEVGEETHHLWALTDEGAISTICSSLESLPLYIADGHHRYETALKYRGLMKESQSPGWDDPPSNFVMMTLIDMSDPGLLCLPYHRLVRGIPPTTLRGLLQQSVRFFNVEQFSPPEGEAAADLFLQGLQSRGSQEIVLGLFGVEEGKFHYLTLKDERLVASLMPPNSSQAWQGLSTSIVHKVLLKGLLGLDDVEVEKRGDISFLRDALEAVRRVSDGEFQLAALVNAVSMAQLKGVADGGERLPSKSTHFYPKLPTGLVINSLDV
ncbi:MAG: DUF1015 domain-containing protein, partial [Dehalococcoidia bacterium]